MVAVGGNSHCPGVSRIRFDRLLAEEPVLDNLVDNGEDNRVGRGLDCRRAARREGEENARGEDEEENRGGDEVLPGHFVSRLENL